MIYVVGFIGFISGFALGMLLIAHLLKRVDRETLLNDKAVKWKYGILTWLIAGLSAYCAVSVYQQIMM